MKKIIMFISLLFLASCVNGTVEPQVEEVVKKMENVKYISTDITDGRDKRGFNQRSYKVDSEKRLLLRYLRFDSYELDIDKDLPVRIQLTVTDESLAVIARENLKICPLSREWMMAATWSKPSFINKDFWVAGGEVDLSQCVSALDPASIPKMNGKPKSGTKEEQALSEWACTGSDEICFDVSSWYHKYVLQAQVNNGWALISSNENEVEVFGDSHHALGPRMQWFSTKYVWVPAPEEAE